MISFLEQVQEHQQDFVEANGLSQHEIFTTPPKISRGENYLGLPWLILDYPRISGVPGIFFIRTMFWWGRFFSSTLHVSGIYKEKATVKVIESYHHLADYSIGINEDPWVHHFEPGNYQPIAGISENAFETICLEQEHLKIATRYPLQEWEHAVPQLFARWKELLEVSGSVA
ncbi:MAG: hypothetical protein ACXWV3_02585 [Flavisolibacter sp.]